MFSLQQAPKQELGMNDDQNTQSVFIKFMVQRKTYEYDYEYDYDNCHSTKQKLQVGCRLIYTFDKSFNLYSEIYMYIFMPTLHLLAHGGVIFTFACLLK